MGTIDYKFTARSLKRHVANRMALRLTIKAHEQGKIALEEETLREMRAMEKQLSKLIASRKRDADATIARLEKVG